MKPRSMKAARLSLALLSACSGDTTFEAPITAEPPVVKAATLPILFASNRDPAFPRRQIFAMKTDGSEMVNLSRNLFPKPTRHGPPTDSRSLSQAIVAGAKQAGSISYDASTNTAIFTQQVPLANAALYGVVVVNIRDATGVPIEDSVNYEFLTR